MDQSDDFTRIVVFEQNDAGQKKIHGILKYGNHIKISSIIAIDEKLPEFVEDPEKYITDEFSGDIVLDFLAHPDLSEYLAAVCLSKNVPHIASGKKIKGAITPFTCCGLGRVKGLGYYGKQFGLPELKVKINKGKINRIGVIRGAPCGATWQVISRVTGLTAEEAVSTIAREVQYICKANPSNFDPISGKSPLHYAGDVHTAALKKALTRTKKT